jgi:hypothetical protein
MFTRTTERRALFGKAVRTKVDNKKDRGMGVAAVAAAGGRETVGRGALTKGGARVSSGIVGSGQQEAPSAATTVALASPPALTKSSPLPPPSSLPACRAVYEPAPDALLGKHLVMTPWMLLDRLRECQEEAARLGETVRRREYGTQRRFGFEVNPLADQLDRLSGEMGKILALLWRGGLWTDAPVEEATSVEGRTYLVLREPFTDGKPHGRALSSEEAPEWVRDLLGIPATDDAPDR